MGNKLIIHHYFEHELKPYSLEELSCKEKILKEAFLLFQSLDNGYILPAQLSCNGIDYNIYEILDLWKKQDLIDDLKYVSIKSLKDNPKPL